LVKGGDERRSKGCPRRVVRAVDYGRGGGAEKRETR